MSACLCVSAVKLEQSPITAESQRNAEARRVEIRAPREKLKLDKHRSIRCNTKRSPVVRRDKLFKVIAPIKANLSRGRDAKPLSLGPN
jgi:hypothetical protein